jgi:hypothetical protein
MRTASCGARKFNFLFVLLICFSGTVAAATNKKPVLLSQASSTRAIALESILPLPSFPFSQIVVKLPDSIGLEGDHQITLTFHGTTSNKPLISIVR